MTSPPPNSLDTLAALEAIRQQHPHGPQADSAQEQAALQRFGEFFSSFAADRIDRLLPATYADSLYFNDTLKTLRTRAALAHYLRESAAAVDECRVQIEDSSRTAAGEYLVRWRMMIRFKRFRRGVDTWSVGMSHLRFDAEGKVVYHQDYWNAADGLFRHVPVLGWMIDALIRRL